jgi:hypothetical protein
MSAAVHRLYAIQEADPDPFTIPAAPDWQRQREAEASRHRPGAWSDGAATKTESVCARLWNHPSV